jgi:hypothetical protein
MQTGATTNLRLVGELDVCLLARILGQHYVDRTPLIDLRHFLDLRAKNYNAITEAKQTHLILDGCHLPLNHVVGRIGLVHD